MSSSVAVLGFDVGGQSVKAALVDGDGAMLEHCSAGTGRATDAVALVETLASLRRRLVGEHRVAERVGIGIAGVLDRSGTLRGAPNLPLLTGQPLESLLGRGLGGSVVVRNDADCAALAEGWGGAAAGREDFMLVTLGTGVGSGLVLGGRIRRGSSGYGCEFGHMIVDYEGRRCGCGNRGCLEAYVSETAARQQRDEWESSLASAVDEHVAAHGGGVAEALFDLGSGGNGEAEQVAGRMVDLLGSAIASAINLLDLTTIVLGGGIAPGFLARIERLRAAVAASLFARPVADIELLAASRGPWAGAIGAARAAITSDVR
ncbi:MAG: ROK family protein [Deltaproteobacteria bacterium]|nr:ROK family protein [Deltaproteobacteria bacterium]